MTNSSSLRARAINELISSEETYVSQLQSLTTFYVNGLLQQKTKIVTKKQYNTLFPPDLKLIYNLNIQLLDALKMRSQMHTETNSNAPILISDILIEFAPHFKMYQNYLNLNQQQQKVLSQLSKQRSFRKFEDMLRPKIDNLGLQALLILPIQRIPRYQLLLKEICKRTENSNEEYEGLMRAYKIIEKVNNENNEKIREFETQQAMFHISEELEGYNFIIPSRRFIYKNLMYKLETKQRQLIFYLFNDCMIYAEYNHTYIQYDPKLEDGYQAPQEEKNTAIYVGQKHLSIDTASMKKPKARTKSKRSKTLKEIYNVANKKKNKYLMCLPIDDVFHIKDFEDNDRCLNVFAIYSSVESLLVCCDTKMHKQKWMKLIGDSIFQLQQKSEQLQKVRTAYSPNNSLLDFSQSNVPIFSKNVSLRRMKAVPLEIPIAYSINCMRCKSELEKTQRHHCGYCGLLCCGVCSSEHQLPSKLDTQVWIGVCHICYQQYRNSNKLASPPKEQRKHSVQASISFLRELTSSSSLRISTATLEIDAQAASRRQQSSFQLYNLQKEQKLQLILDDSSIDHKEENHNNLQRPQSPTWESMKMWVNNPTGFFSSSTKTSVVDDFNVQSYNKDEIVKQGTMHKIGKLHKNWKKRHFILYKSKLLKYYEPEDLPKLKHLGIIDLNLVDSVSVGKVYSQQITWTMELNTPSRIWILSCKSIDERDEWMDVFNSECSTNPVWNKQYKPKRRKSIKEIITGNKN